MEPEIFNYLMDRFDVKRFRWCAVRERKTGKILPGRSNHPYESHDEFTNECMFVVKYPYDSVAIDVHGIDELRQILLLMDKRWQLDPSNRDNVCLETEHEVCNMLAAVADVDVEFDVKIPTESNPDPWESEIQDMSSQVLVHVDLPDEEDS